MSPRVLLVMILQCFATSGFAFQISTLELRVVDQTGALIANSTVRLKLGRKLVEEIKHAKSGDIFFDLETQGQYLLEIEAVGFKSKSQELEVKPGRNVLVLELELNEIVENVEVEKDQQEKSVDEAFSGFLSRKEIESLPDSPEELEKELKARYGEDTIIRVNGFTGRVPAKSQISSIKVNQSSFDAENHELGFTYVDIFTKVGKQNFTGSIAFNFNDESINARNPFALARLPEQHRFTNFFLLGPVIENSSSFYLSYLNRNRAIEDNIIAILPNGRNATSDLTDTGISDYFLEFTQNLKNNHIAKISYLLNVSKSVNLGIGGFNLPERGFSSVGRFHQFRFSESGYIGDRFLNNFRFEFISDDTRIIPNTTGRTITVLEAFSKGSSGNQGANRNKTFSFADTLLFGFGQHALKIGAWTKIENRTELSSQNIIGTFVFSSIGDFEANRPSIYTESPEARTLGVSQLKLAFFIQDDWRIRKNLSLSFGMRYEWQNNLSDGNNFSPRVGFTWSPGKTGKTTLRGGVGVFYNWLEPYHLTTIEAQSIERPGEIVILNPGFPNPYSGGSIESLPKSYWKRSADLKTPYIFHSSIGIENRLPKKLLFRANYTFQKGVHQFRSRNVNAPYFGIRPNASFGNINQLESSSFFVRKSLRIGLSGSVTNDVSFNLDYTLSKKISDSDDAFRLPTDNFDLTKDRSVASDDQRHRLYASVNWIFKKSFQVSGIFTANSPLPYTITTGRDANGDTIFNDRPLGVLRNSERGAWNSQTDLAFSWLLSFVNRKGIASGTSAVSVSSSEANTILGYTDERKRFSVKNFLRIENVFNQTNYRAYSGVQTSSFFRQPISAFNPRRITLGIRFNF